MLDDQLCYRTFSTPISVEDGRTIIGLAVPFNKPARINEYGKTYHEVFVRGAFRHVVRAPNRVKLVAGDEHSESMSCWVGRAQYLEEKPEGLYAEFRVDDTPFGEALTYKVRDGQITGLSVGFVPGEDRKVGNTVERRLVKRLPHVAAVETPAYAEAAILGVRAQQAARLDNLAAVMPLVERMRSSAPRIVRR